MTIVDHHTYVFVGDGCLMEGISHEACSLAGTLGLGKLIALYDDNGISIDGNVQGWFTDDTPKRFEAYGWNVIRGVDGHDVAAVDARDRKRAGGADRPTPDLLQDRDRQGRAAPAGTAKAHGAALGEKEVAADARGARWTYAAVRDPGRRLRGLGRARGGARGAGDMGQADSPPMRRRIPEHAARVRAPHGGRPAGRFDAAWPRLVAAATQRRNHRHAQGLPAWRSRRWRRRCRNSSAARPT